MTHRTGRVVEQGRRGRAADARVRLLGIPVDTFCATEAYAEKALRELALQVLPPPDSRNGRPGAEQALGDRGFAELNEQFFDLAEHAADFHAGAGQGGPARAACESGWGHACRRGRPASLGVRANERAVQRIAGLR